MVESQKPVFSITKHALQRYKERTGCNKSDKVVSNRIINILENRKRIGKNEWYVSGFVFVIHNNIVITVMKPKHKNLQDKIFKTFNKTN